MKINDKWRDAQWVAVYKGNMFEKRKYNEQLDKWKAYQSRNVLSRLFSREPPKPVLSEEEVVGYRYAKIFNGEVKDRNIDLPNGGFVYFSMTMDDNHQPEINYKAFDGATYYMESVTFDSRGDEVKHKISYPYSESGVTGMHVCKETEEINDLYRYCVAQVQSVVSAGKNETLLHRIEEKEKQRLESQVESTRREISDLIREYHGMNHYSVRHTQEGLVRFIGCKLAEYGISRGFEKESLIKAFGTFGRVEDNNVVESIVDSTYRQFESFRDERTTELTHAVLLAKRADDKRFDKERAEKIYREKEEIYDMYADKEKAIMDWYHRYKVNAQQLPKDLRYSVERVSELIKGVGLQYFIKNEPDNLDLKILHRYVRNDWILNISAYECLNKGIDIRRLFSQENLVEHSTYDSVLRNMVSEELMKRFRHAFSEIENVGVVSFGDKPLRLLDENQREVIITSIRDDYGTPTLYGYDRSGKTFLRAIESEMFLKPGDMDNFSIAEVVSQNYKQNLSLSNSEIYYREPYVALFEGRSKTVEERDVSSEDFIKSLENTEVALRYNPDRELEMKISVVEEIGEAAEKYNGVEMN